MRLINTGYMLPGATPFKDENLNPTWKANVLLNDKTITVAFVKLINKRKIVIESLCAIIGRSLNLPIPKPVLTLANHNILPENINKGESLIAFGSIDSKHPSLRRYIKDKQVMKRLKSYKKINDIGTFDEWIGNWDRNIGNMLYGGNNDFVFIDHENAIGENLSHTELASTNQIINFIIKGYTEDERIEIFEDIQRNCLKDIAAFSLPDDSTLESLKICTNVELINEILVFLELRVNSLFDLLSRRLNIKQLGLEL